jgi:very-short-patch-repair endonuclease
MCSQSLTQRADRVIARLAARQHGVVARRQLLAAGITARQITHRLAAGRLHELHRGIYLVGHTARPPHAAEQAALLALGESAVLSHQSAAHLWNLLPRPADPVRVTVAPGRNAARPGIAIHRAALDPQDIRRRHRLALTSPPRTILDLAADTASGDLEHIVADAAYRGLASEEELRDQIERNPRRRGVRALARVLGFPEGPQRTRSQAERRMLRLLREAGIGDFVLNHRVHGYEVDVLWRDYSFAIEIDGYDGHSSRVAFERDRLKVAKLKARGLDVMPVSARQVRDDPHGVVARAMQALRHAGYPGD